MLLPREFENFDQFFGGLQDLYVASGFSTSVLASPAPGGLPAANRHCIYTLYSITALLTPHQLAQFNHVAEIHGSSARGRILSVWNQLLTRELLRVEESFSLGGLPRLPSLFASANTK
jgi:hypothetical protein